MNLLIIEINKAEQMRAAKGLGGEFNEFHRMNNSDEIIEANPTLAGRKLAGDQANYDETDELMMHFLRGSPVESDSSVGQRFGHKYGDSEYKARSVGHRPRGPGEMLDRHWVNLSQPKVSELIPYDTVDYSAYQGNYTNSERLSSLIEYDDLYVVDQQQQPIDQSADRLANGSDLMNGQIGSNMIGANLIGSNLPYNDKEFLNDDLDLSTLIVPPPPKLDSNLAEQDELLRNFQKATNELKTICQSCQGTGEQVAPSSDFDYPNCFNSTTQVTRDLHSSSSSADSGYESVLLINNSQKLVDINQKLVSSSLNGFPADSRTDNYVLVNNCTIGQPKAPPRLNKLKGNLKLLIFKPFRLQEFITLILFQSDSDPQSNSTMRTCSR